MPTVREAQIDNITSQLARVWKLFPERTFIIMIYEICKEMAVTEGGDPTSDTRLAMTLHKYMEEAKRSTGLPV